MPSKLLPKIYKIGHRILKSPAYRVHKMAITGSPVDQFYRKPLPGECIAFSSVDGKNIFKEALDRGTMNCYFALAEQFRTQDEPAFCGLSTLVMVLNTLQVDPQQVWKGPWRWYHENMLDCCVPLQITKKKGINLEQFACLADCSALSVEMQRAYQSASVEDFRKIVERVSQIEEEVLVCSYSRPVLGQTGSGHFSPIGGYHADRDLVLILDTARFKYPPHWVELPLIWRAMQDIDEDTGKPRGYFLLSKSERQPLVVFRISNVHVKVPPQEEPLPGKGVHVFIHQWNSWLNSSPTSQSDSEKEVYEEALVELLKAATYLNAEECILTTRFDLKCQKVLSKEHRCAAKELVASLEALSLFTALDDLLSSNKTGPSSSFPVSCVNNSPSHVCKCGVRLKDVHFYTMIMLSWPIKGKEGTNGALVKSVLQRQLSQGEQVLQNEALLLQKQICTILGYEKSCCDSCYCTREDGVARAHRT